MSEPTATQHKRAAFAKEKGEIVIREHTYDGIEEFDQKLPNWWLFTFYIAIAWFVGYWVLYYSANVAQTDQQRIEGKLTAIEQKKIAALNALVTKWATDTAVTAAGQATFTTHCVPCHAADLSATLDAAGTKVKLPGLPLNDHQWKYGNEPRRLFQLINEGTPKDDPGTNGARMEAWGQKLTPKQVAEVLSYVISKVPDDFASYRKQ